MDMNSAFIVEQTSNPVVKDLGGIITMDYSMNE